MTAKRKRRAGRMPRFAAGCLLSALIAAPAGPGPLLAQDGEDAPASAFRLYFTIPFVATHERRPARLGFQLMSETSREEAYSPLRPDPALDAVLDLAFSRNGLERFEVHGADMRGAYAIFTRAGGLSPQEMTICREGDCPDAGKARTQPAAPPVRLGAR